MFKNNILGFGNINHKHLWWYFTLIIKRKTCTVTLCACNTPIAESAVRVVNVRHNLTTAAVRFAPTIVI